MARVGGNQRVGGRRGFLPRGSPRVEAQARSLAAKLGVPNTDVLPVEGGFMVTGLGFFSIAQARTAAPVRTRRASVRQAALPSRPRPLRREGPLVIAPPFRRELIIQRAIKANPDLTERQIRKGIDIKGNKIWVSTVTKPKKKGDPITAFIISRPIVKPPLSEAKRKRLEKLKIGRPPAPPSQ